MTNKAAAIVAVVVTYEPDLNSLYAQFEALCPQVSQIIVVDNGSSSELTFSDDIRFVDKIRIVRLGDNLGIGYAQNVGIEIASELSADFVVLFDQDSCPADNMIEKLHEAFCSLNSSGIRVGAVGPRYKDAGPGVSSGFVRAGFFGFSRTLCSDTCKNVEADFLISSGSLISLPVLESVGDMDATLFIDHVDTEWCFRAKSKGFRLFGVCDAFMAHTLGDRRKQVWFLRWRTVPYHSPFRYYYMFRNSLILMRRPYMPLIWKVADAGRCARSMVYFGLFSPQRGASLKMMFKGLIHGARGRRGKL